MSNPPSCPEPLARHRAVNKSNRARLASCGSSTMHRNPSSNRRYRPATAGRLHFRPVIAQFRPGKPAVIEHIDPQQRGRIEMPQDQVLPGGVDEDRLLGREFLLGQDEVSINPVGVQRAGAGRSPGAPAQCSAVILVLQGQGQLIGGRHGKTRRGALAPVGMRRQTECLLPERGDPPTRGLEIRDDRTADQGRQIDAGLHPVRTEQQPLRCQMGP